MICFVRCSCACEKSAYAVSQHSCAFGKSSHVTLPHIISADRSDTLSRCGSFETTGGFQRASTEYGPKGDSDKVVNMTSYARRWSERAQDVLNLLRGHVVLEGKKILDLGCGSAPISEHFRGRSSILVGLDINRRAVRQARRNTSLDLVLGDATNIPFRDASFGFVLCNDVLEHVSGEVKLMQEVLRVLAQRGAAYIQCANKYQIVEPHFLLPFLSWIPRRLANIYLKIARRGRSYDDYFPRTHSSILALAGTHRTIDLTYERTLMKIEGLNIQSNILLRIVSLARKIFSDRSIAAFAQNFSIISILVFKDETRNSPPRRVVPLFSELT